MTQQPKTARVHCRSMHAAKVEGVLLCALCAPGSWSHKLFDLVKSGTKPGDVRVDGPYGGSLSSHLDQCVVNAARRPALTGLPPLSIAALDLPSRGRLTPPPPPPQAAGRRGAGGGHRDAAE